MFIRIHQISNNTNTTFLEQKNSKLNENRIFLKFKSITKSQDMKITIFEHKMGQKQ